MKKVGADGQKFLKIMHLIMAGLWLGGAFGLTLMTVFLGPGDSGGELYAYDMARKFVDDWLVIPGAMGCLLTGLLISLLTPWGFFKHRWVALKWLLTVSCILFGTFVLGPMVNGRPPVSAEMGLEALDNADYMAKLKYNSILGGAQVGVIFFMMIISTLKPWRKKRGIINT